MMRIGLIASPLHGEIHRHGGGPLTDLVLALRERGHDITVLSQHDSDSTEEGELAGLPARLVPAKRREAGALLGDKVFKYLSGERKVLSDARRIARFIADRGPFDVVWAICEAPDGLAAGLAKKFFLRKRPDFPPLLITVQAIRWRSGRKPRTFQPETVRFQRVAGLKRGFLRAELVAANSRLTGGWLRKHYGVSKERLAYYPVNFSRQFLKLLPEPLVEVAPDAPIVFFGALNPTKGPDIFLEAAARLVETEKINRPFVMIGGKTEKNPAFDHRLERLRQDPGLQDRLELTGRLSLEEMMPRLRQAALVVCPSRVDTFSRAVIESLALGTPVVASTHVGAREILEDELCGAVAPLNAHDLAQAIRDALERRGKLAEFTRASITKLLERHRPQTAAAKIEQLLEQCCS